MSPEHADLYLQAFASAPTCTGLATFDGDWIDVNPAFCEFLGYTRDELLARGIPQITHPDDVQMSEAALARIASGALHRYQLEKRYLRKDGSVVWGMVAASSARSPERPEGYLVVQVADITAKKNAERALARSERALKTLTAVVQQVIHAEDEAQLPDAVCRAIVEIGGYKLAWVGEPRDDDEQSVVPVAFHGPAVEYLRSVKISWGDNAYGRGPTGTAMRTGQTQVNPDFLRNAQMTPWRDYAIRAGLRSSIALPLKDEQGNRQCLTIYATEADAFDPDEVGLLQQLADELVFGRHALRTRAERDRIQAEHAAQERKLKDSLISTIEAIASMVEMRDPYTAGHQGRVADLASAIAREMGLDADRIEGLRLAALVHDVGKIKVPAEILNKPGRLDPVERALIRQHPESGFAILADIAFPWPIARMVHEHHERYDGSGYPQGLAKDAILLESRILAVADVIEAMHSHRPYRSGLGLAAALAEIRAGSGSVFDPEVCGAALRLFEAGRYQLGNSLTAPASGVAPA